MAEYAAALDQGTTSTRCMVFDHGGQVAAVEQLEHEQIYPKAGWVEHDPNEIWQRSREVMDGALEKVGAGAGDIAAIGITNQRETTVVEDHAARARGSLIKRCGVLRHRFLSFQPPSASAALLYR